MSVLTVNLINQYAGDLGFGLDAVAAALEIQGNRDFAPFWGSHSDYQSCKVLVESAPLPGAVPIYVKNITDLAGAEGEHDDNKGIEGNVFVDTTRQAGDDPITTISHEFLELWVDPLIDRKVKVGRFVMALECCDAVEETFYRIAGLAMSNFQTPAWFGIEPNRAKVGGFDYMNRCLYEGEILTGGYMSELRSHGWVQVFGSPASATRFNHAAHHRVNKRHGRHQS